MKKWNIQLQLYFIRTNDDVSENNEPSPTSKQLDTYMRKGTKYKEYLKDMYIYGDYGEMPKNIKYTTGGKLSYTLTSKKSTWNNKIIYSSKRDILDDILRSSFEDGMYGAGPGSHGVYPTKKQYKYVNYQGKNQKSYEELGVIDCRNSKTIKIEEIKPKVKSKSSIPKLR